jgi:3-hydroxyisobutyrate dehydrogenase
MSEALTGLAAKGILAAGSLEEAVSGSDAVMTMVPTGDIVASLAEQLLPAMSAEAVWIQTSTVGGAWTDHLYTMVERAGRQMIDSPVSGSTRPAESGQLTMSVSGPAASVNAVERILEALSVRILRVGHRSEASRIKLVVNGWMVTATLAMGEAFQNCHDLGVGVDGFLSVLRGGPLNMDYALTKADEMQHHDYPLGFAAELAHKDLALAFDEMGHATPLLTVVQSALEHVMSDGNGRCDVGVLGEVAGQHEERVSS